MTSKKYSPEKKRAALAKIGVAPYGQRRDLGRDEKSYIARLWRKYGPAAVHGSVALRTASAEKIQAARESGFQTYRGKIIVETRGAVKVKLTRVGVEWDFLTKHETAIITRRKFLPDTIEQMLHVKRKPGEYITAKVGTAQPWGLRFESPQAFLRYTNNFVPMHLRDDYAKATGKSRRVLERKIYRENQAIFSGVSIVKIKYQHLEKPARKKQTKKNRDR